MPLEDICAQMTQVPTAVWAAQLATCGELVERRFHSVLVGASAVAYFWTLYKIVSYVWLRYFVLGPLLAELRAHFALKNL